MSFDDVVKRDDGYYCRICGGYVGDAEFSWHEVTDCLIELRSRLDELAPQTVNEKQSAS